MRRRWYTRILAYIYIRICTYIDGYTYNALREADEWMPWIKVSRLTRTRSPVPKNAISSSRFFLRVPSALFFQSLLQTVARDFETGSIIETLSSRRNLPQVGLLKRIERWPLGRERKGTFSPILLYTRSQTAPHCRIVIYTRAIILPGRANNHTYLVSGSNQCLQLCYLEIYGPPWKRFTRWHEIGRKERLRLSVLTSFLIIR